MCSGWYVEGVSPEYCWCHRLLVEWRSRPLCRPVTWPAVGHGRTTRWLLPALLVSLCSAHAIIIDHPRSGVVYNFSAIYYVCLSVCMYACMHVCHMITFESLDVGRSFSFIRYNFIRYGSSSYRKVIRLRSRSHEQKTWNVTPLLLRLSESMTTTAATASAFNHQGVSREHSDGKFHASYMCRIRPIQTRRVLDAYHDLRYVTKISRIRGWSALD